MNKWFNKLRYVYTEESIKPVQWPLQYEWNFSSTMSSTLFDPKEDML